MSPAASAGAAASAPMPSPSAARQQQGHVADRLRGRREQQALRLDRKRLEPPQEAPFDAALQRRRAGKPESAGQLRGAQPPGQLQQRQRVTAGLADDAVPHPLIQPSRDHRVEQCTGVTAAQALDLRSWEAASSCSSRARAREHQGDRSASRRRATNASACAEA